MNGLAFFESLLPPHSYREYDEEDGHVLALECEKDGVLQGVHIWVNHDSFRASPSDGRKFMRHMAVEGMMDKLGIKQEVAK